MKNLKISVNNKPHEIHFEYDEEKGLPELGIAPGTKFEDLPEDFACPLCGVGKENFEKYITLYKEIIERNKKR